jgi:hypothetical protein
MRTARQWRHLKLHKWHEFAHKDEDPKAGASGKKVWLYLDFYINIALKDSKDAQIAYKIKHLFKYV